ncbi:acylglycerol kinase, mitochondrial-like [Ostrea edulis]|uniref:acylglycerol kinase, mitochondrial-like n=1 Tax=Ostrea edulis TaxID=37623 RepID=UPI0024AFB230|nr:acylglycerol kinase, mitochondrial-like [Ostrea edulis]
MAKVVKILQTVRDNWKKSIFAVVVAGYGVKFVNRKFEEDLLRREYCKEAKKYGEVKIKFGERPRKITVFLNPAASSGKASKLFEKNAAPLLHLAGLEVNLVKTEYEGQVKKFMEVLDRKDTDGVIAAGGGGTLLETVTGVMKKNDKDFAKRIPVGVIPLGKTNLFAKILFGSDKEQVRFILDSTLAVVDGFSKKMDVVEYMSEDGRSTYSMMGLTAGAYVNAEKKMQKYWYFGPLKSKWTYIRSTLTQWPSVISGKLSYVPATEENTKLQKIVIKQAAPEVKRSWWNILHVFYKPKPQNSQDIIEEMEAEDNEEEEVASEDLTTVELSVLAPIVQSQKQKVIAPELDIGPSQVERKNFISEGLRREKSQTPVYSSADSRHSLVKKVKFIPDLPEDTEKKEWFYIDGEQFEAVPVEIRLLRNRLNIFHSSRTLPS